MNQQEQIQALADRLLAQQRARITRDFSAEQASHETVRVVPGNKYTKVDVGSYGQWSGKLMVEHATGVIYGIKAYGQVHKGHRYGTLDTIGQWYWGRFYPEPATTPTARMHLQESTLPLDPPGSFKTVTVETSALLAMLERAREAMEGDSGDAEYESLLELVGFGEALLG